MTYRPYTSLTSSGVQDSRKNDSGSIIAKGTPIRIDSSGTLSTIDVSIEAEALGIIGAASENIVDGGSGLVVNSGKIEDISTTANLGDLLYISKTGDLTSIKPSIGVNGFLAGDFVVMVGVIAKNEVTPALKDLVTSISIVGQL